MRTILLTGGARGLGQATTEALAALGHHVILTARDEASAQRVAAELRRKHPAATVEAYGVDLTDFEQVRRLGRMLVARGKPIDVLVNCAGVLQTHHARQLTNDGREVTFTVNALAPFLLTASVWPALVSSPSARVVNVSSRLHLPGSRGAPVDFDFDDPFLERGYGPERAYKNSKLALMWFTFELARRARATKVTANAVCPGFVPVTAAESTTGFQHWLMQHVLPHMPFATSVEDAVNSLVFMAVDPSLDGVSEAFYGEKHPIESSPDARDVAKAQRFWSLAASLSGVDEHFVDLA